MKTDRSGRTFEEYRQLFWDEQKRVKELDGFITEYQKRELNFLERITALVAALSGQTDRAVIAEATIKRVRDVGFDVHPSWGSSDDFYRGWKACRKQIEEALGETK